MRKLLEKSLIPFQIIPKIPKNPKKVPKIFYLTQFLEVIYPLALKFQASQCKIHLYVELTVFEA